LVGYPIVRRLTAYIKHSIYNENAVINENERLTVFVYYIIMGELFSVVVHKEKICR